LKLVKERNGNYVLNGNKCKVCNIVFFPKKEVCISCFSSNNLEEFGLENIGILHTYTIVHRSFPQFNTPYTIGYVDLLNSGVRVFAPIKDSAPDSLNIGDEMKIIFETDEKGQVNYYFVRKVE